MFLLWSTRLRCRPSKKFFPLQGRRLLHAGGSGMVSAMLCTITYMLRVRGVCCVQQVLACAGKQGEHTTQCKILVRVDRVQ